MKRLILVRHAKSDLNQPLVSDHNRILSESGRMDAKLIGQYLYNNHYFPSHIISSSAIRTLETSKIIIKEIGFKNSIEKQSLIYTDSTIEILNFICDIDNNYESVMLVGHNPTITELINHITNIKIDYMPTCGIAIIEFEKNWMDINKNGQLIDFMYPKKIKENQ